MSSGSNRYPIRSRSRSASGVKDNKVASSTSDEARKSLRPSDEMSKTTSQVLNKTIRSPRSARKTSAVLSRLRSASADTVKDQYLSLSEKQQRDNGAMMPKQGREKVIGTAVVIPHKHSVASKNISGIPSHMHKEQSHMLQEEQGYATPYIGNDEPCDGSESPAQVVPEVIVDRKDRGRQELTMPLSLVTAKPYHSPAEPQPRNSFVEVEQFLSRVEEVNPKQTSMEQKVKQLDEVVELDREQEQTEVSLKLGESQAKLQLRLSDIMSEDDSSSPETEYLLADTGAPSQTSSFGFEPSAEKAAKERTTEQQLENTTTISQREVEEQPLDLRSQIATSSETDDSSQTIVDPIDSMIKTQPEPVKSSTPRLPLKISTSIEGAGNSSAETSLLSLSSELDNDCPQETGGTSVKDLVKSFEEPTQSGSTIKTKALTDRMTSEYFTKDLVTPISRQSGIDFQTARQSVSQKLSTLLQASTHNKGVCRDRSTDIHGETAYPLPEVKFPIGEPSGGYTDKCENIDLEGKVDERHEESSIRSTVKQKIDDREDEAASYDSGESNGSSLTQGADRSNESDAILAILDDPHAPASKALPHLLRAYVNKYNPSHQELDTLLRPCIEAAQAYALRARMMRQQEVYEQQVSKGNKAVEVLIEKNEQQLEAIKNEYKEKLKHETEQWAQSKSKTNRQEIQKLQEMEEELQKDKQQLKQLRTQLKSAKDKTLAKKKHIEQLQGELSRAGDLLSQKKEDVQVETQKVWDKFKSVLCAKDFSEQQPELFIQRLGRIIRFEEDEETSNEASIAVLTDKIKELTVQLQDQQRESAPGAGQAENEAQVRQIEKLLAENDALKNTTACAFLTECNRLSTRSIAPLSAPVKYLYNALIDHAVCDDKIEMSQGKELIRCKVNKALEQYELNQQDKLEETQERMRLKTESDIRVFADAEQTRLKENKAIMAERFTTEIESYRLRLKRDMEATRKEVMTQIYTEGYQQVPQEISANLRETIKRQLSDRVDIQKVISSVKQHQTTQVEQVMEAYFTSMDSICNKFYIKMRQLEQKHHKESVQMADRLEEESQSPPLTSEERLKYHLEDALRVFLPSGGLMSVAQMRALMKLVLELEGRNSEVEQTALMFVVYFRLRSVLGLPPVYDEGEFGQPVENELVNVLTASNTKWWFLDLEDFRPKQLRKICHTKAQLDKEKALQKAMTSKGQGIHGGTHHSGGCTVSEGGATCKEPKGTKDISEKQKGKIRFGEPVQQMGARHPFSTTNAPRSGIWFGERISGQAEQFKDSTDGLIPAETDSLTSEYSDSASDTSCSEGSYLPQEIRDNDDRESDIDDDTNADSYDVLSDISFWEDNPEAYQLPQTDGPPDEYRVSSRRGKTAQVSFESQLSSAMEQNRVPPITIQKVPQQHVSGGLSRETGTSSDRLQASNDSHGGTYNFVIPPSNTTESDIQTQNPQETYQDSQYSSEYTTAFHSEPQDTSRVLDGTTFSEQLGTDSGVNHSQSPHRSSMGNNTHCSSLSGTTNNTTRYMLNSQNISGDTTRYLLNTSNTLSSGESGDATRYMLNNTPGTTYVSSRSVSDYGTGESANNATSSTNVHTIQDDCQGTCEPNTQTNSQRYETRGRPASSTPIRPDEFASNPNITGYTLPSTIEPGRSTQYATGQQGASQSRHMQTQVGIPNPMVNNQGASRTEEGRDNVAEREITASFHNIMARLHQMEIKHQEELHRNNELQRRQQELQQLVDLSRQNTDLLMNQRSITSVRSSSSVPERRLAAWSPDPELTESKLTFNEWLDSFEDYQELHNRPPEERVMHLTTLLIGTPLAWLRGYLDRTKFKTLRKNGGITDGWYKTLLGEIRQAHTKRDITIFGDFGTLPLDDQDVDETVEHFAARVHRLLSERGMLANEVKRKEVFFRGLRPDVQQMMALMDSQEHRDLDIVDFAKKAEQILNIRKIPVTLEDKGKARLKAKTMSVPLPVVGAIEPASGTFESLSKQQNKDIPDGAGTPLSASLPPPPQYQPPPYYQASATMQPLLALPPPPVTQSQTDNISNIEAVTRQLGEISSMISKTVNRKDTPYMSTATGHSSGQGNSRFQQYRRPAGHQNKQPYCTFHNAPGHWTSDCRAKRAADQDKSMGFTRDDFNTSNAQRQGYMPQGNRQRYWNQQQGRPGYQRSNSYNTYNENQRPYYQQNNSQYRGNTPTNQQLYGRRSSISEMQSQPPDSTIGVQRDSRQPNVALEEGSSRIQNKDTPPSGNKYREQLQHTAAEVARTLNN